MRGIGILGIGVTALLAAVGFVYGDEAKPVPSTSAAASPAAAETVNKRDQKGAPPPELQRRNPRYRVESEDVLDISFPLAPEFNQPSVTVQPDGYITLLGVGSIHAEGQTLPELTQSLQEAYAKILHDPIITVDLKTFDPPYFIASGQVLRPGRYDLRGDLTVTQGVAIAGGLLESAKHSEVFLFRRVSSDWMEVKKLNVKQILQAKNVQEDLHLQSGDMIYVPKNKISKFKTFIPYSAGVNQSPTAVITTANQTR